MCMYVELLLKLVLWQFFHCEVQTHQRTDYCWDTITVLLNIFSKNLITVQVSISDPTQDLYYLC